MPRCTVTSTYAERHDLADRDHDARHEHDQRERPRPARVQVDDAGHDRVATGRHERRRREHRKQIRRHIQHRRRDEQRPRALDRVLAPEVELLAATRAMPRRLRASRAARRARTRGTTPAPWPPRWSWLRSCAPRDARPHHARVERARDPRQQQHERARRRTAPGRGSLSASCAILVSATRMPSSSTSFIDHGRRRSARRMKSPIHAGAGGR